jgi:hypothetical protein
MGMKVGIVDVTCHIDREGTGGLKLWGNRGGEAMQLRGPPLSFKDLNVNGGRREEHNLVGVAFLVHRGAITVPPLKVANTHCDGATGTETFGHYSGKIQ